MIEGVEIFEPDVFTDFRGDLWTTWKEDEFPYDVEFNHDKVSTSRKNVLRGILVYLANCSLYQQITEKIQKHIYNIRA